MTNFSDLVCTEIACLTAILVLSSCSNQTNDIETSANSVQPDTVVHSQTDFTDSEQYTLPIAGLYSEDWPKYQDSLRTEILKDRENEILKRSFLQEFYIRNAVWVSGDSLFFALHFDLHGPDCGAPDCYSTNVSFRFPFNDTVVFPTSFAFTEYESGCLDTIIDITGMFRLQEQTPEHVIYHDAKHKRTLVLFSSRNANGTKAFYFTEVEKNRVTGKNVYTILSDYNEEDSDALYPFTSWSLTTNEYEHFLE